MATDLIQIFNEPHQVIILKARYTYLKLLLVKYVGELIVKPGRGLVKGRELLQNRVTRRRHEGHVLVRWRGRGKGGSGLVADGKVFQPRPIHEADSLMGETTSRYRRQLSDGFFPEWKVDQSAWSKLGSKIVMSFRATKVRAKVESELHVVSAESGLKFRGGADPHRYQSSLMATIMKRWFHDFGHDDYPPSLQANFVNSTPIPRFV